MSLYEITDDCIRAKRYFSSVTPGPVSLLTGLPGIIGKKIFLGLKISTSLWKIRDGLKDLERGKKASTIVGDALGTYLIWKGCQPVKARVGRQMVHMSRISHDPFRKNGIGGRFWYSKPGRHELIVVFHDANRAGPHIDVHIGRMSLVYRVKPEIYNQLKYNRNGYLTEDSRKLLIDHVRSEINTHSRVPQNLDHSKRNARDSWVHGDRQATHYGAGYTRQVILEDKVDIYKAHANGPIEMYAPALNPDRSLYLYRLQRGDTKHAPILIFGAKAHTPPKLVDRLHLKMVRDEAQYKKLNLENATIKYDGSSAYIVITPKGTEIFSPRKSVVTGEQIVYTHKLNGLASVTSTNTIIAMGEIMFKDSDGNYLPQSVGSGILNSHSLMPDDVTPEIRLYRVDRYGRRDVSKLPFNANRYLQEQVATLHPYLEVVERTTPQLAESLGYEGVVAIPPGKSVNEGFKYKFVDDTNDWRIDSIDFHIGERGGSAGVVHLTSLDSGKRFKLGPGQMGDQQLHLDMMINPDNYIGRVVKVESRRGHEGRAAKVVAFHDDK